MSLMKGSIHTRGRKELTKTTAQQYAVCHTQPRRGNIEDQTNFNDGDVKGNYHPQTRIQDSGKTMASGEPRDESVRGTQ